MSDQASARRSLSSIARSLVMAVVAGAVLAGCSVGGPDTPCSPNAQWSNSYGTMAIQQQSAGSTIPWGIYPNDPVPGVWEVDVFAGNSKVDGKVQTYSPHGSISSVDYNSGDLITISGNFTGTGGEYQEFWMQCQAS